MDDEVDLAGFQRQRAGIVVRYVAVDDFFQLGCFAPIVIVAYNGGAVLLLVLLEYPGTGADRLHELAVVIERGLAVDDGDGVGQLVWQGCERFVGLDFQFEAGYGADFLDVEQVGCIGQQRDHPLQRELCGFRVKSAAVMEGDAVTQLEAPDIG